MIYDKGDGHETIRKILNEVSEELYFKLISTKVWEKKDFLDHVDLNTIDEETIFTLVKFLYLDLIDTNRRFCRDFRLRREVIEVVEKLVYEEIDKEDKDRPHLERIKMLLDILYHAGGKMNDSCGFSDIWKEILKENMERGIEEAKKCS